MMLCSCRYLSTCHYLLITLHFGFILQLLFQLVTLDAIPILKCYLLNRLFGQCELMFHS